MLAGKDEIKIHGSYYPVKAEIASLDTLSAHADQDELMQWLKQFEKPPKVTFLNHGEPAAREALKARIEEDLHWQVELPEDLQSFAL